MTTNLTVSEVLVACDTVECGYRLVELEGGRFAFVWGNVRAGEGDTLPESLIADATDAKGAEVFDSFEAAERAYRDCAEALQQTNSPAGDEMLARLEG